MKTITWPTRNWQIREQVAGRFPIRWLSRTPGNGDENGDGDQGDEGRTEPPPFGVPPSEGGRSGNLGPPPPDLLRDLTGSGSEPPPPYEVARQGGERRGRLWPRLVMIVVVLLVLFVLGNIAVSLYVDRLWFGELGFIGVFTTRVSTQIWLFFGAFGIAFAFLMANLLLAWRLPLESRTAAASPFAELSLPTVQRGAFWTGIVVSLFLALIFGSVAVGHWEEILQFMHAESFGQVDPEFQKDFGFYVFKLEPLQFIKGWATGLAIVAVLASVSVYGFRYMMHQGDVDATRGVRLHVAIQLFVVIALFVWGYWLARFELAVSSNGVVFGATYTDTSARSVALVVMMVVGAAAGLSLLAWPLHRRLLYPGVSLGVLVAASIGGTIIYPAVVQRFTVQPNELTRETEFIERNIAATRFAFGLDQIDEREFPAEDRVTVADLEANPEVLRNVRLWDHRPLRDTLNTIQTIRQLYVFPDVDVDRYEINGEIRQVFLAVRELSHDNLREDQQGWVNQRLQFTHGFGLTVSPVNEFSQQSGEPTFFVSDIPPQVQSADPESSEIIEITEPRIYFGEATGPYVIVNSESEEFDFPLGSEGEQTTRYAGEGGIQVGGFLKRAALAWEFGDTNILVSGSISGDSRLLFRRNIQERVHELAPFLALDEDPYVVIGEDGRLYWIQDAYTTTNRIPYSEPSENRVGNVAAGVNYIRNSVKVVIDAFNGSVDLYIVDEDDPIIRVWSNIFPELFRPASEFPADLRSHWRYPQDLFQIQANQYLIYHITSPSSLFRREGVWDIPTEILRGGQLQAVEPYYVTLQLPDSTEPEFLLIEPFTPRNRLNAIAWLAGRSDGENYGKLFAFRFPTGKNVPGPAQIEGAIDTNTGVSAQFTLLGQQGSEVIRGNLLFLPVGDSYLYVESIFLQAESLNFPLLRGVVVVNGPIIALEETLDRAADVVLGLRSATGLSGLGGARPTNVFSGEETTSEPEAPPVDAEPPPPEDEPPTDSILSDAGIEELIEAAQAAFDEAQRRFASSDFAEYGRQLELLEEALNRLEAAIAAQ